MILYYILLIKLREILCLACDLFLENQPILTLFLVIGLGKQLGEIISMLPPSIQILAIRQNGLINLGIPKLIR